MKEKGKELDFLLGAVSPMGFSGHFSQVLGVTGKKRSVLIKAGPGCGKSTLMKKISVNLSGKGHEVELIHCSSDPDSLDGVICRETGFSIVDATAPHTLEPLYPVACEEILSLYQFLDKSKLQANRAEISELFRRCGSLQERAARYITAAGALLSDSMRMADSCIEHTKAKNFAAHLSDKYLPRAEGPGEEECRLLSATTCKGQIFYENTILKIADKELVILEDDQGAASKFILRALRDAALIKGHRVITCYCPMSPHEKIDHLLLPDVGVAFTTSNSFHPCTLTKDRRVIHCSRFVNDDTLKLRRQRLRFNRKAAAELLRQASLLQAEAKENHDKLEKYYIEAVDFTALDKVAKELIQELG
ncbi:MAG: hypothetical protein Q4G07_07565 [Oscillospiraceae bacterium]|nr:hypothetical protein [Oscillospiraceae bacterium]